MSATTSIEWCDHTFNHVSGCTKVSPGCANCYAEVNYSVKMRGVKWGPNGNRIVKAESGWKEPLKWNRDAEQNRANWERAASMPGGEYDCIEPYVRPRVFCASLADVFEDWDNGIRNADGELCSITSDGRFVAAMPGDGQPMCHMSDVRARLFRLIDATPNLDWLLLTKRPENIGRMLGDTAAPPQKLIDEIAEGRDGAGYARYRPNVWLGVSVENQATKTRIDLLRTVPAVVRFVSFEPLLEHLGEIDFTGISWAICGGESGPKARPCNVSWIRDLVRQCKAAGVKCFAKQLGSYPFDGDRPLPMTTPCGLAEIENRLCLKDKKGGDIDEFPEDLRVREFPETS